MAMAADLGYDIYRMTLKGMTDNDFSKAISCFSRPAFVLLEDVDDFFTAGDGGTAGVAARNVDKRGMSDVAPEMNGDTTVSFSAFINALSGTEAPNEVVFCLTTNRLQTFDPVVKRRISMSWRIGGVNADIVAGYLTYHLGTTGGLEQTIADYMNAPKKNFSAVPYEMSVLHECLVRAYGDNVDVNKPAPAEDEAADIPLPSPKQVLDNLEAYVPPGVGLDAERAEHAKSLHGLA
jgi:hypothetical protein